MDAREWEEFILEWIDSLRHSGVYTEVHKLAGAGDNGRDVVGYKGTLGSGGPWDNYQCKHYDEPLNVATVLTELGKLLYFVSIKEITCPDKYEFVSPQGPSTDLLKCMEKNGLKDALIARWDKLCKSSITSKKQIEITPELKITIECFDYKKIKVVPPLEIIEGHKKTPYHVFRFGGGLPDRELPIPAPDNIQPEELVYIEKLLAAYGEAKSTKYVDVDSLTATCTTMAQHLQRSREHFFCAESLRSFSRDNVPPGTFETLQNEIYDGIQDVYLDTHPNGYRRAVETVKGARALQITGNPLVGSMYTNDRAGICHQLANEDRLVWVHREQQR